VMYGCGPCRCWFVQWQWFSSSSSSSSLFAWQFSTK